MDSEIHVMSFMMHTICNLHHGHHILTLLLTSLESMFYWHGIYCKRMMDQEQGQRQESSRPLPSVGRARGLTAIVEMTRREEEMRLR